MRIAILDPFSGISGDMTLGAQVASGLDPDWLRALPARLGLGDVGVKISVVQRGMIDCVKVDFEIPPQPHGRHLRDIRALVEASEAPDDVRSLASKAFEAIAQVEGELHGVAPEKVHLHEVGAVDAILDVVGAIWGFRVLGVERVYCGTISMGDGFVQAAHGRLPVPAPATLRLLEGHRVRPGPENSGELVTPTGAALVHVLSHGPPPDEFTPTRSGFGAGTKEFPDRANALRLILAETVAGGGDTDGGGTQRLVLIAADVDDMPGEYIAAVADSLRAAGALDVVLTATVMKKGRPGTRIEALSEPGTAHELEDLLLRESTSIGVRSFGVTRRALARETRTVQVFGQEISVKVVHLPGGGVRVKPEFEDVRRVARATGQPVSAVLQEAALAAEHPPTRGV